MMVGLTQPSETQVISATGLYILYSLQIIPSFLLGLRQGCRTQPKVQNLLKCLNGAIYPNIML